MRLEPVYLVEPRPPNAVSRRAFVVLGSVFASGTALGAMCGIAAAPSGPVRPTADTAIVAWLQRLAAPSTPIEDLLANHRPFLLLLEEHALTDAACWRGVQRLADAVLTRIGFGQDTIDDRRALARTLYQLVTHHPAPVELDPELAQSLAEVR